MDERKVQELIQRGLKELQMMKVSLSPQITILIAKGIVYSHSPLDAYMYGKVQGLTHE